MTSHRQHRQEHNTKSKVEVERHSKHPRYPHRYCAVALRSSRAGRQPKRGRRRVLFGHKPALSLPQTAEKEKMRLRNPTTFQLR